MPMRRTGILVVTAVVVAVGLTACAPASVKPAPSAAPSASRSAAPNPTPTATVPALPGDVLFEITATATAADGTAVKLSETVHAPVTATDHQAGDETQLDNECDGWRQAFANTQFLVADVSYDLTSGSAWGDAQGQIAVDMAGYPVWSGDQTPYQAACATALAVIPGSARAVSPVNGGDPDADGGWAVFRYGFGMPEAGGATPAATEVTFTHCRIQMGAAAKPSVFATSWVGHPETDGGDACRFGGTG